eukprot:37508-Eustigmatos_ZCMA.PRE.1
MRCANQARTHPSAPRHMQGPPSTHAVRVRTRRPTFAPIPPQHYATHTQQTHPRATTRTRAHTHRHALTALTAAQHPIPGTLIHRPPAL